MIVLLSRILGLAILTSSLALLVVVDRHSPEHLTRAEPRVRSGP